MMHPMLFAARRMAYLESSLGSPNPQRQAIHDMGQWAASGYAPSPLALDATVDTWVLSVAADGRVWPIPALDRGDASWSDEPPRRGPKPRAPRGIQVAGWRLGDSGACTAILCRDDGTWAPPATANFGGVK